MISVIDVGSGNIESFVNVYNRIGIDTEVVSNKTKLLRSRKIILPGVGSFDSFMNKLNFSGLKDTLEDLVLNKQVPIMGICVGMQVLGIKSEEGKLNGLGWIDGNNYKFAANKYYPVPAMGWSEVITSSSDNSILKKVELSKGFYFLHSYYFKEEENLDRKLSSFHGIEFTSGFQKGNIIGIQFHPEKSHQNGIQLLKNFAEMDL